jgi:hypothetical protein
VGVDRKAHVRQCTADLLLPCCLLSVLWQDTQEVINHPVLGPLARETLKRIDPEIEMEEAVMPLTRLPGRT